MRSALGSVRYCCTFLGGDIIGLQTLVRTEQCKSFYFIVVVRVLVSSVSIDLDEVFVVTFLWYGSAYIRRCQFTRFFATSSKEESVTSICFCNA